MAAFARIVTDIILPIFVLVGAGAALERRFKLDIGTISKLSFYCIMPALLFEALIESTLQFDKLAVVAAFQVALILAMCLVGAAASGAMRLDARLSSGFLLAAVFCNSANFGIPLVQLAFPQNPSAAIGYQAITIMVQNLATFSLGLAIANRGKADLSESLRQTLKFPFLYVVIAALVMKYFDWHTVVMSWPWFWNPIKYAGEALVAIALLTLGIQIAKTPVVKARGVLTVAVVTRLVAAPAVAFILVKAFAYIGAMPATGMLPQLLVIAAAGPSAVNTVLITLEVNGEPDFAAASVFYSTILSGITVAMTIFVVQNYL